MISCIVVSLQRKKNGSVFALIMATIDRASPMAAHESDFNGGPSADELKARGYPPRNSGLTAEVRNHRRCALALSVGHCLL